MATEATFNSKLAQKLALKRWITRALFCLSLLAILISSRTVAGEKIDKETCTYKGMKLYGKVEIVESFPDIKVEEVSSFPDLKVQQVTAFPDKCGKWQFVESFPDFKVQFVEAFPDIQVQYVKSFPGVP